MIEQPKRTIKNEGITVSLTVMPSSIFTLMVAMAAIGAVAAAGAGVLAALVVADRRDDNGRKRKGHHTGDKQCGQIHQYTSLSCGTA